MTYFRSLFRPSLTAGFFLGLALSLAASGCGDDPDNSAPARSNNNQDDNNQADNNQADTNAPAFTDRLDAPVLGIRGAHKVGFQAMEVDREGDPLLVKVWYPTGSDAPESMTYEVTPKNADWAMAVDKATIDGRAVEGAEVLQGDVPHPVVIFSHGFALNPEWYSDLTEHYASHGFLVLAPEHTEADWFETPRASFDRPRDITLTLDFAESLNAPGGLWAGRADMEKVAVVGHSYGGYTALAAAGAQLDLAPFQQKCGALHEEAPEHFLCAPFAGQEMHMAGFAGLDEVPEGLWPSLGDDRVRAAVPIAGDAYLFGEQGMSSVTVPVMAMGGTADFGTPWGWGPEPAYQFSSGETRVLVGFQGGSHFLPANRCETMPWVYDLTEIAAFACLDPVWDKGRALDLVQHFSTAFLKSVLQKSAEAKAMLAPEAAAWTPGLVYEVTE